MLEIFYNCQLSNIYFGSLPIKTLLPFHTMHSSLSDIDTGLFFFFLATKDSEDCSLFIIIIIIH